MHASSDPLEFQISRTLSARRFSCNFWPEQYCNCSFVLVRGARKEPFVESTTRSRDECECQQFVFTFAARELSFHSLGEDQRRRDLNNDHIGNTLYLYLFSRDRSSGICRLYGHIINQSPPPPLLLIDWFVWPLSSCLNPFVSCRVLPCFDVQ
jgi:hypothetical protein